jgi:xylose dehydrogenase (NAD/NADP)
MNNVRWGLLSTAGINRRLIPAIRESSRGTLAAVASRSQAAAEAYAVEWKIPRAFASYQAMLDSDVVDAVYIGLPNHMHAEWSVRALRGGKHVLCEKPFALTVAEVDRMLAAAEETGMVLAEAFMYRHHPQTKRVGEFIRSGRLGEISLVRAVFNFAIQDRDNIRLAPEKGGGSLWDVGVYPVSFAQYIMGGPPHAVLGNQRQGDTGVDELFAGQMYYGGGRMAQISSSLSTPFYTAAEVLGSGGRLTLNRPFVNVHEPASQVIFYPADGPAEQLPGSDEYLYLGEVEDMHAAILDGAPNYLALTETRDHVRTVLALYESAKTGRVVALA